MTGPHDRAAARGDAIVEFARAKINLTLRVLGRRPDGYHELESLVGFADWADRIDIDWRGDGPASAPATFAVQGPFAAEIIGENLAERALRLVEAASGVALDASILLTKNLPVTSGVGGGSANAAAVLRALERSSSRLAKVIVAEDIARRLGADVPVCVFNRPCVMSGTGDRLRLIALPSLKIVMVNPRLPVPADKTRQVFQALAAPPLGNAAPYDYAQVHLRKDLVATMREIGNDLEAPACRILPAIAEAKAAVAATTGCEIAFLSGAGPTVIGLYDSGSSAADASAALSRAHPAWWVMRSRIGPSSHEVF